MWASAADVFGRCSFHLLCSETSGSGIPAATTMWASSRRLQLEEALGFLLWYVNMVQLWVLSPQDGK